MVTLSTDWIFKILLYHWTRRLCAVGLGVLAGAKLSAHGWPWWAWLPAAILALMFGYVLMILLTYAYQKSTYRMRARLMKQQLRSSLDDTTPIAIAEDAVAVRDNSKGDEDMPLPLCLENSERLFRRAVQLIPGGSQTMSKRPGGYAPGAFPIYIQRGHGAHVWDVDGNEYIDYIMALGPITLGYCYEPVDRAIAEQLKDGTIFGLLHPLEVEAAEAVCDIIPCAEMVRFMKGGAEVTQAAARIARAYTGNEVLLNCGYRGWVDTWQASGGNPRGIPDCLKSVIDTYPYNDLDALRSKLEQYQGQVAAIFLDPVSGEAPDDNYLAGVRQLCDQYGVLLVFDEIVTGFRLAPGGAQEYFSVTPDLACFAKGIANGMPIACVCGRAEVMQVAADLVISVTYGGECLSLAALIAAINEYRQKPVTDHMWHIGQRLTDGFAEIGARHGVPLSCSGLAPMSRPQFGYQDADLNHKVWSLFLQETAKRGVLLRREGLMLTTFSHSDEDVDKTLDVVDAVVEIIATAVSEGNIDDILQVKDVDELFRRF